MHGEIGSVELHDIPEPMSAEKGARVLDGELTALLAALQQYSDDENKVKRILRTWYESGLKSRPVGVMRGHGLNFLSALEKLIAQIDDIGDEETRNATRQTLESIRQEAERMAIPQDVTLENVGQHIAEIVRSTRERIEEHDTATRAVESLNEADPNTVGKMVDSAKVQIRRVLDKLGVFEAAEFEESAEALTLLTQIFDKFIRALDGRSDTDPVFSFTVHRTGPWYRKKTEVKNAAASEYLDELCQFLTQFTGSKLPKLAEAMTSQWHGHNPDRRPQVYKTLYRPVDHQRPKGVFIPEQLESTLKDLLQRVDKLSKGINKVHPSYEDKVAIKGIVKDMKSILGISTSLRD